MAPPRRIASDIGEALRVARGSLRLDQAALAARIPVSVRQLSRWENGVRPGEDHARRLALVLAAAPAPMLAQLRAALRLEPLAVEAPATPPAASVFQLRGAFDAIIYAAAESRDVLPRHLRAFAVELFQGAARLGVEPKEAALLVATPERASPAPQRAASPAIPAGIDESE